MGKLFIPDYHVKSIYTLDYDLLYNNGIRVIFLDLDNTLISYKETLPYEALKEWKKTLEAKGFTLMIISNSRKDRVSSFAQAFDINYVKFAKKPAKRGFKEAMKRLDNKFKPCEICEIGDQVMTDVLGANRMHFTSILVDPIDRKAEMIFTRINRFIEKIVKLNIRLFRPKLYKSRFILYKGERQCKEDV